jgi:hypothetical protein
LAKSEELERAQHYELLNKALANLKAGYENRDLQRLRQITVMSETRVKFLQQIFSAYSTIRVSISALAIADHNQSASAILIVTNLIDAQGNRATPGEKWKETNLIIKKEGNQWGKINW